MGVLIGFLDAELDPLHPSPVKTDSGLSIELGASFHNGGEYTGDTNGYQLSGDLMLTATLIASFLRFRCTGWFNLRPLWGIPWALSSGPQINEFT